eukprot:jgi/Chlat1/3249/Chrsp22S03513
MAGAAVSSITFAGLSASGLSSLRALTYVESGNGSKPTMTTTTTMGMTATSSSSRRASFRVRASRTLLAASGSTSQNGRRNQRRLVQPHASASSAAQTAEAAGVKFPHFLPKQVEELEEPAARSMASRITRVPVKTSLADSIIEASVVGPESADALQTSNSCLEFRRLHPVLTARGAAAWAVDLLGWGFNGVDAKTGLRDWGPVAKRELLYEFWRSNIGKPMVLAGASLGGAAAIDFAVNHPDAVHKLVLIDAQGFIDGVGNMKSLPRPLATAGIEVLRSWPLRSMANRMAYHDQKLATTDAIRVGRLHTYLPGWRDANIEFMRSGGYSVTSSMSQVTHDALVLWGENDGILKPEYAQRFAEVLPSCKVVMIPECGHVPHLEQPARAADELSIIGMR